MDVIVLSWKNGTPAAVFSTKEQMRAYIRKQGVGAALAYTQTTVALNPPARGTTARPVNYPA